MYPRSAKGGEKGDPNRNPWLAKMLIIMLVKYVLSDGISQAFLSKDATSRFGFNENIFPVCQSFETFHLVDSKCFQIKFITNKFFFTGRCHYLGYILKFVRNATWWFIEVAPLR
jgi:hypothetical protein